jgi:hypothetical protein
MEPLPKVLHGRKALFVVPLYVGPVEEGERALAPLRGGVGARWPMRSPQFPTSRFSNNWTRSRRTARMDGAALACVCSGCRSRWRAWSQ